ncbi:Ribosomal RNA processing protein 1-like protein A [Plecturocebus cupreus]
MEKKRSRRRRLGADPEVRAEATEQLGTAERALLREQPRGRGQRGARQRRGPRARAQAKVPSVQEPEEKKKRRE